MLKDESITPILLQKSMAIRELFSHIIEMRPALQSGLFCTSNSEAFVIAEKVINGTSPELNSNWVDSLNLAWDDVLRISESNLESLSLDDLDLPIQELLNFIQYYDEKAAEFNYDLEDMRRTDFIGLFCIECDQEIGELDCPNCSTSDN